jgi:hypothetical protein
MTFRMTILIVVSDVGLCGRRNLEIPEIEMARHVLRHDDDPVGLLRITGRDSFQAENATPVITENQSKLPRFSAYSCTRMHSFAIVGFLL